MSLTPLIMLTERPYFAHFRRPRTRSGAENSSK
jgi:hypothetical protein